MSHHFSSDLRSSVLRALSSLRRLICRDILRMPRTVMPLHILHVASDCLSQAILKDARLLSWNGRHVPEKVVILTSVE